MTHIAELVNSQKFEVNSRPLSSTRSLKTRAFLGVAALAIVAGLGLAVWHGHAGGVRCGDAAAIGTG